jgi:hydrogenase maturation protein HypF
MATAARFLKEGKVLAIKGLGGFLLACDATSEKATELLRERKRRVSPAS